MVRREKLKSCGKPLYGKEWYYVNDGNFGTYKATWDGNSVTCGSDNVRICSDCCRRYGYIW